MNYLVISCILILDAIISIIPDITSYKYIYLNVSTRKYVTACIHICMCKRVFMWEHITSL